MGRCVLWTSASYGLVHLMGWCVLWAGKYSNFIYPVFQVLNFTLPACTPVFCQNTEDDCCMVLHEGPFGQTAQRNGPYMSKFMYKFHSYIQLLKVCGNKMPTRCNKGFYCRSYCLLNMFRASLCPSSAAQEYYTVVAACGILCCVFFK